jgi:soluble lytic murein transglycosylase-like protein
LLVALVILLAGAGKLGVEPGPVKIEVKKEKDKDKIKEKVIDWMVGRSRVPVDVLEVVYEEAHKHTFPELLIAIAMVESRFDPSAVSPRGAVGLMQVMARVWEEELKERGLISGEEDLFDISRSISASDYILRQYLTLEGGDIKGALMRYVGTRSGTDYQDKVMQALSEMENAETLN